MFQFTNVNGLSILTPPPAGSAGAAINNNFTALSTLNAGGGGLQGIDSESTPTFAGLSLTTPMDSGNISVDSETLTEYLLTRVAPLSATGTPQAVDNASTPTFNDLYLTTYTPDGLLYVLRTYVYPLCSTGGTPQDVSTAASPAFADVTLSSGSVISNFGTLNAGGGGLQGIDPESTPTFAGLSLTTPMDSGNISVDSETLTEYLLTRVAPLSATGTPQAVDNASTPTFNDLYLTTYTPDGLLYVLRTYVYPLCSTGGTPQDVSTAASPAFVSLSLSDGIGLYGTTPPAQYGTSGATAGFTAGSSTTVTVDSTFSAGSGTAYTIGDIVAALKSYGLLAT